MRSRQESPSPKPFYRRRSILAAFAALLLLLISPRIFFTLVGMAGPALLLLSVVVMLRTYRTPRPIRPRGLVLSLVFSVLGACAYTFFLKGGVGPGLGISALFAGCLLGAGWTSTARVECAEGRVLQRGNVWYLVIWAGIFALSQTISLLTRRLPDTVLVAVLFGVGLAASGNITLLVRYFLARASTSPAAG